MFLSGLAAIMVLGPTMGADRSLQQVTLQDQALDHRLILYQLDKMRAEMKQMRARTDTGSGNQRNSSSPSSTSTGEQLEQFHPLEKLIKQRIEIGKIDTLADKLLGFERGPARRATTGDHALAAKPNRQFHTRHTNREGMDHASKLGRKDM